MIHSKFRYWLLMAVLALILPARVESREGEGMKHQTFSQILGEHVRDGLVDYVAIQKDARWPKYLSYLAKTEPSEFKSIDEQLAFWINAYNAYTIQLILDRWPLESIKDIGLGLPIISGPWSIEVVRVGGKMYTLNQVEHDIIRPRFKDPRIHFALVCAAISCPKLRPEAYEGSKLNAQLDEEARRFLGDPLRNRFDLKSKTVHLSMIFNWFESDFEESAGDIRKFLQRYVNADISGMLNDSKLIIQYMNYDWDLNQKK